MTLNRDAAFRLKVNVDGANQISAFNRDLRALEGTAKLNKAQLGQMNIQINRMAREAGNSTAGIRQHIAALTTLRDRVDLNSNAYKRLGREIDQLQIKLRRATATAAAPTGGGRGGADFSGALLAFGAKAAAVSAAVTGAALLTRQITDVGVASVESERRLNLLSRGFDDFQQVQNAASAAATKFGLTQTEANQQFAQIYARLRPVGLSLKEVTAVYNGFNTAAKLSGTNSQEASSAFLQLSQALGSGVLRGEELNSVFEQTPVIVQAIAKEMGVAIGEIRGLAKEGKITSDIVLRALQTIERDGADKLAEAMKGPAQQFKNLEIEVENLKKAVADLSLPTIVEGTKQLGSATADTTTFVKDLGDAWKYVNSQIDKLFPKLPDLGKQFEEILPFLSGLGMVIEGTPGLVKNLAQRQRQAEKDAFIGPPAPELYGPGFGPTTTPTPDRAQPDLEKDKTKIKEITQIQLDAGLRLLAAKQTGNELLIAELQYEASLADLDQQKMGRRARELAEAELANNLLLTQLDYAERIGQAIAQDFLKREELQENYNRTVEELRIKAGEITGEEAKQLEIKHQVEAILKRLPGLTDEQIAKIKELVAATQEQGKSFKESFQDKIDEYKESLADFGGQAAGAVINAFQGMEDALTTFVTTGKANFRDLANSIIADITRIAIRQAIIKPLVGALFPDVKNANGNVFASNGIVPFAKGGIVDRPMVFPFAKGIGLMGEAGPEAIMPLRRGPGGRLGVESSGSMGNIVVNVDATGSQAQGNTNQGKQLGEAIGVAIRQELIRQKRPGGLLA